MKTYILVRAFYSLITLWLLVTIIFAMVRLTGDPVKMKGEVGADAVYLEQLRSRWGLDKPLYRAVLELHGESGAGRLRPLLREIAAGSRHLFGAPAQLAQAWVRCLHHLDSHRHSSRDAVGAESEYLVGQRRQGVRPAGLVYARLFRRPGPDHHLRGGVGLAACPGQRMGRSSGATHRRGCPFGFRTGSTWSCPPLPSGGISLERCCGSPAPECSMSWAATTSSSCG